MKSVPIPPKKGLPVAEILAGDPVCKMAQEVHQKIAERAYEFFCASGCTHGHDIHDWLQAEREVLKPIPVEVSETAVEITIRAEVPGFLPKDIALGVEEGRFYIHAQPGEQAASSRSNREPVEAALPAFRVVDLSTAVDRKHVRAWLADGVVEIVLSKVAEPGQKLVLSHAA
jgi:HSP20 family molecular chaperone IbpA